MEIMYIDKSPRKYHSFPLHEHGFWEITVNLAGSGIATVNGQEYPFNKGSIFCTGPGILHGKVSSEGFIDGSLMLRDFKPFGSSQVYCLEDDAHGSFQSLFSLIFNAVMNNGLKAQAVVHALADAMYQLMLSWSDIGDRNPTVEHFQKVLLDNLSNREFDLSEEIRRTGYSSSYFRKLFNRFTGNSPIGYLNYMRIECAKRQIQHYLGTRSMKEIAHDSGFEDPYYFSRVFRKYTGANPLRYAKEIGEVKVQKVDGEPMAN